MTITNLIVTAYLATSRLTANNHIPRTGYTIAAPRSIPFGTRIYIPSIGWRIVEDRTARKYDGRIDIFMGRNLKAAKAFGKQTLKVTIYDILDNK